MNGMADLLSRAGYFLVPAVILEQQPQNVAEALARIRFLPSNVELEAEPGRVLMSGFSPLFDVDTREAGKEIPQYELRVHPTADGTVSVEVTRVKEATAEPPAEGEDCALLP